MNITIVDSKLLYDIPPRIRQMYGIAREKNIYNNVHIFQQNTFFALYRLSFLQLALTARQLLLDNI